MADKHKSHIKKLEAILRLMENDEVTTELVRTWIVVEMLCV